MEISHFMHETKQPKLEWLYVCFIFRQRKKLIKQTEYIHIINYDLFEYLKIILQFI